MYNDYFFYIYMCRGYLFFEIIYVALKRAVVVGVV